MNPGLTERCAKFLSTLSLRRATRATYTIWAFMNKFLSTLSLRRATWCRVLPRSLIRLFLSTLSLRRATFYRQLIHHRSKFLSTLSLRRATHQEWSGSQQPADFYPRSPCGERLSLDPVDIYRISVLFLSTLSLRRATYGRINDISRLIFLSTLSLRRATDTSSLMRCQVKFLSTLSLRRATWSVDVPGWILGISIHALLAESDIPVYPACQGTPLYFYPRSPCGERLWLDRWSTKEDQFLSTLSLRRATILTITICTALRFLSTLSLRRATNPLKLAQTSLMISIHALLAESDKTLIILPKKLNNFYPRSPCGERHGIIDIINNVINDFYPRSPCGERRIRHIGKARSEHFYPRSPCGERLASLT